MEIAAANPVDPNVPRHSDQLLRGHLPQLNDQATYVGAPVSNILGVTFAKVANYL